MLSKKITAKKIYFLLFAAYIIKFGMYGFEYFPILDDYIQYNVYNLFENPFKDVILRIGTFTTRPLANLADVYFYANFWGYMGIIFLLITVMHFFSAYFIEKSLSKSNVKCGSVFYIIFGLYPLLTEATYWISASSRLVVGTFFAALSVYLLTLYFEKNKKYLLVLYALTNLISYGFYEQIIVLSFVLSVFIIFLNRKKSWIYAVPVVNLALIGAWYIAFLNYGAFAGRSEIGVDIGYQLEYIITSFKDCLGAYNVALLKNSFIKGLKYTHPLYITLIAAVSLLFIFDRKRVKSKKIYKVILGIALIILPFLPNLVLPNAYISNRNMFVLILGAALIIDAVAEYIKFKNVILCVTAFFFLVCNAGEMHDYKAVYEADKKICESLVPYMTDKDDDTFVYLVGAKISYIEQSSLYAEHIRNVTHADWALTGAMRSYTGNPYLKNIIPVPEGFTDFKENSIILCIDENMEVTRIN